MSGFAKFMRTALHQEPIIIWSCMISTVGIALPLIVPPIREALYKSTPKSPPPVKQMIQAASDRVQPQQ
ncbi:hypothetical protein WJX82_009118 [Trebouxia sp. C0006]